jgi:putative FmdB family regulatory protein
MYDFACRECGQAFEKKLKMSQSSDPQACPICGSDDTRRRMASSFAMGGNSASQSVAVRPTSSPFT